MSGRGRRRKTRWKEDARRRDVGDGRRIGRRAGGSETEEGTFEKENALSRSRGGGGGAERGWIKASTRGGNKERTKKVEEVGGGGWVPWSALIGSTWSDEKFNHPPVPNSSSTSSFSSPAPPPSPTPSAVFLSFSLARIVHSFSPPEFPLDESTAHLRASRCLQVSMDQDEETKSLNQPVSTAVFVNTQHRFHPRIQLLPFISASNAAQISINPVKSVNACTFNVTVN